MIELTADLAGIDAIITGLEAMQDASAAQRRVLETWSGAAVRIYQRFTPVGRGEHPGRLKAAYTETGPSVSATAGSTQIGNTTPYLRYVLEGRGVVTASPGKMLRFVIDGRVFFRKSVGPAKANPFDKKAEAEIEAGSGQYAEMLADAIAERLS